MLLQQKCVVIANHLKVVILSIKYAQPANKDTIAAKIAKDKIGNRVIIKSAKSYKKILIQED